MRVLFEALDLSFQCSGTPNNIYPYYEVPASYSPSRTFVNFYIRFFFFVRVKFCDLVFSFVICSGTYGGLYSVSRVLQPTEPPRSFPRHSGTFILSTMPHAQTKALTLHLRIVCIVYHCGMLMGTQLVIREARSIQDALYRFTEPEMLTGASPAARN